MELPMDSERARIVLQKLVILHFKKSILKT